MSESKAVLIIGGSGFVGTHLALRLREDYRVITTYRHNSVPIPGVLSLPMMAKDDAWLNQMCQRFAPEVLIYLGGPEDPLLADRDLGTAERLHSSMAGDFLKVTEPYFSHFIYASNTSVFDGKKGNYRESESVAPSTNFGRLKVAAENWIKSHSNSYTIMRFSPLIGRGTPYRPSWFDRLRIAHSRNEKIELGASDYFSFTSVTAAVDAVTAVMEAGVKKNIYHYGGLTRVTPYEVGLKLCEQLKWNPDFITPKYRPQNLKLDYSLNSSELIRNLNTTAYEIDDALESFRNSV